MELILGLVLPPAIDFLNKEVANENERFIVACLTCIIAAVVVDYQQILQGNASNLPVIATTLFTEATLLFNLYWKKSFKRDQFKQLVGGSVYDTAPKLG